jgi:hypothetical protein
MRPSRNNNFFFFLWIIRMIWLLINKHLSCCFSFPFLFFFYVKIKRKSCCNVYRIWIGWRIGWQFLLSSTWYIYSQFKAMFVSWNSLSGKPLSKLSCVCLPLEKLVNGKHFPVNENTFWSTKTLSSQRKIWFSF